MSSPLHTLEEGQRVHYLANLGGLVAIAGLEDIEPALLLGAFIEMNTRLRQLSSERLTALKQKGSQALHNRQSEKRSFKSWQRAQSSERFDLTRAQMQALITTLGGKVPALEKDLVSELRRLLRALVP
jgi:hypothetical protein